jgi:hypothetical protein
LGFGVVLEMEQARIVIKAASKKRVIPRNPG